jgi:hypothetical protein
MVRFARRVLNLSSNTVDSHLMEARTGHSPRPAILWVLFAVGLLISSSVAPAQEEDIIAGPYGVPRMVKDDLGNFQESIEVFRSATTRMFIPDITGPAWAAWHVKKTGERDFTYFVDVYSYYPAKRATAVELIYVNTRDSTHVTVQTMFYRKAIDISKNPILRQATSKITALVRPEAMRQPSETAAMQQTIHQNAELQARMAACIANDPDCNLSLLDFEKKHPAYPKPALELVPGAIPGVNCGVGTNRSCCCASGANGPTGVKTTQSDNSTSLPDSNGTYKIGGSISAPVAVITPSAEYTLEARRVHYEAVCVISVIVDPQGNTRDLQVIRGLEYGLTERALQAVSTYKFRPALKDGECTGTSFTF